MATKTEANKKNDNKGQQKQTNGQTKQAPQQAQPAAPQAPSVAATPAAPKPLTPEQTDVKAILLIKDRKLTKKEAGLLRSAGLKKDGTSFSKHQGPRTKPDVTLVSVKNAVETFGVEAVAKMADRYGKAL